jgi:hypothetical protein
VVQDGTPRTKVRAVWAGLAVAAAGAAVGLAVEFVILAFTSVPGGPCGGRYRPCPDGTTPTVGLAATLAVVGFFVLRAALDTADGRRIGEEDGVATATAELRGTGVQLLRADGTWIVVNGVGTTETPLYGLR